MARRGRGPHDPAATTDATQGGAAPTLEPAFEGDAYKSDKPRVPHNIYDARDAFAASDMVEKAFGDDVVDHYLNYARVEIDAFEAAVTDWERYRGFERL